MSSSFQKGVNLYMAGLLKKDNMLSSQFELSSEVSKITFFHLPFMGVTFCVFVIFK